MRSSSVALTITLVLTWVGSSAAQSGPIRGLFGLFTAAPSSDAKTRLDVFAALVEGYDSDVPTALRPALDPDNFETGGLSTTLSSSANFDWTGGRAQVGANATSVVRYYSDLRQTRDLGHSAGLGTSARLSDGTSLFVNQSAAYSPSYLSALFPTGATIEPGDAGTTASDLSISQLETYSYITTANLTQNIGRRSKISLAGEYQYSDRLRETARWSDVSSYVVRSNYSRNVTRNSAFTAQVRYRNGEFGYGNEGITSEVGLDVGASFSRQISATRRATFNFSVGLSGADEPAGDRYGDTRQYFGVGEAGFEYPFTRTWAMRVNYKRGVEYLVDLPEPVFSDGLTISTSGFVSRRFELYLLTGYSSGESLLNRDSWLFDTYLGDVRVRYALNRKRTLALYTEYLYYYYVIRENTQPLVGIPPGLERNGVRVGLILWVPALRR